MQVEVPPSSVFIPDFLVAKTPKPAFFPPEGIHIYPEMMIPSFERAQSTPRPAPILRATEEAEEAEED